MRPLQLEETSLKSKLSTFSAVDSNEVLLSKSTGLDFQLSPGLEANEPPEARGLTRDQVRLMVSDPATDRIVHTHFQALPDFLEPGDLLVINTSGTRNAALDVTRADGTRLELHLSTHLPSDDWTVELRLPFIKGALPFYTADPGEKLTLPGGASATLLAPYGQGKSSHLEHHRRLWIANIHFPVPVDIYLDQYGFPIRYKYVRDAWPNEYYQTVYATEKGSAEMPSAGRAFTYELITRLVARGVQFAPLLLHTGVASLEDHEPPYEEYFRVPMETVRLINSAHQNGKRVIAVGTTVVRALETVTKQNRETFPGGGWTKLVITPERGLYAVDGLLTGFHEPQSTHLAMLGAIARSEHLRLTYNEALKRGYLWHEFGDLHLILKSVIYNGF